MNDKRSFVDTNVLVYAYDSSAGQKHSVASKLLSSLWESGLGILSVQVLQEFLVTVTKKIPKPLDLDVALEIVRDFLQWEIVPNDAESIIQAVAIQKKHQLSFWDALIIQAADRASVEVLFSEDLSHGQKIANILIQNPFR